MPTSRFSLAIKCITVMISAIAISCAAPSQANSQHKKTAVVVHSHFKLIMDCKTKLPLVVVYRTGRDLSNAKRHQSYLPDPKLMASNPSCHPNLNHPFKTYQAKLRQLNVDEEYDVGHLAMSNHLDINDEIIKSANYFSNLAPQVAKKNRSGGAWYATEKIVECHRDIEPLINLVGVIDDPATTDKDYFVSTFGQTTPDFWWRVIYFERTQQYFAWLIPNDATSTETRLYQGAYDISLAQLMSKLAIGIPELITLRSRNTIKSTANFIKTKSQGAKLTCRGKTTSIS